MADRPLLSRVRVLAAVAEDSPGTAEDLTATEAAFNVYDAKIEPEIEMAERLKQGGYGRLPSYRGALAGRATFGIDLTGGAVQPGWAAVFLPACGFAYSTDHYVLDKTPPEADGAGTHTLTFGIYEDGRVKSIYGAQGKVKGTFDSGKIVRLDFEFLGIWATVADAAILAPTYPTDPPLRFSSSDLSIGGAWSPKISQLVLDINNTLYLRPDAVSASGFSNCLITDRQVTGAIDPEARLVDDEDLWGDWLSSVESTFTFDCVADDDADDDCSFTATKFQVTKVSGGNRENLETDPIEFSLNNDDLEIAFGGGAESS